MGSSLGLKDLMRAVQNDLPVTLRHERWLIANGDASYSPEAIEFARQQLAGEVGGSRSRALGFRASGMGKCPRARLFAITGTQGIVAVDSRSSNTFQTGHFLHLKWQMAGLTEGWLAKAEVPLYSEDLNLGGTADGFIYDGSLFEFKTINKRNYDYVTRTGPLINHKLQTGAYKLLEPSLEAVSIVYENKETGEWREYREYFPNEVIEAVLGELEVLNAALRAKVMPPMLDPCERGEGHVFRQCPFREVCPKTKVWPS
jgi:hypothetical protein